MLSLESVFFATLYLEVDKRCEVSHFLFYAFQSHESVQFLQAVVIVHNLWSVVWHVVLDNGHELVVAERVEVTFFKSFRLLFAYLVEELPHCPSVGEVFVSVFIQVPYDHYCFVFRLWCKQVFLVFGERKHDFKQFVGRVVVDIEEIVESAFESRVYSEEVVHLHSVSRHYANEFSPVVLHSLHQFFQCLSPLLVSFPCLAHRSESVGLIHEENAAHGLVAEFVYEFWCLPLIWAHHFCPVYLHHMSAV